MLIVLLGAIACLAFLTVGFILGLATYAHVYQHFRQSLEAQAQRKILLERHRAVTDRAIIESTKDRLIAQYGTDLSRRHQEIVDEELAAVITKRGGGNGR